MKLLELYGYSPQEPKNRLTELGVRRNYTTGLVSDAANRRQQQIKEGVLPQSNAPQRMPGSIVEDDAGNAWINRDGQLVALNSREHRVERDRETGDLVAYQKSSAEIAEQDAQPIARGLIAPFEIDDDGLKLAWPDLARNVGGLVGGAYSDPVGTAKAFGQGVVDSVHDAATAPVRAYRGEIPEDEMVSEAFNLGGMAMLGGFAAPRPTGSIGMGGRAAKEALDMSEAARLARAKDLGYDTDKVWYHGTRSGSFDEFDPEMIGTSTGPHSQGFYFTDNPALASQYAKRGFGDSGLEGGAIVPVHLRSKNPFRVDFAEEGRTGRYGFFEPEDAVKYARQNGYDSAIIENYHDGRGVGTQYVVLDPSQIRSVNAAFDPAKSDSANILAANAKTGAAVPLVTKALEGQQSKGITAYHGSPHDFDRFSMEHIGTGEGAQAYGHGLYFAEAEDVAKAYRDALAKLPEPDAQAMQSVQGKLSEIDAQIAEYAPFAEKSPAMQRQLDLLNDSRANLMRQAAEETQTRSPSGHMYEVRINADPEDFLDWDKPLRQQSEKVRAVDDAYWNEYDATKRVNGYQAIDAFLRSTDGAKVMREAGIPGIRYLDQMSRGAGEGSRNYVIFDDAIIDIVKKYGLAGAVALGALSQSDAEAFAAQFGE